MNIFGGFLWLRLREWHYILIGFSEQGLKHQYYYNRMFRAKIDASTDIKSVCFKAPTPQLY